MAESYPKMLENTVGKGEIALVLQTRKNQCLFGKGSITLMKMPYENMLGRGITCW